MAADIVTLNIDCMEFMKGLADKSYDLAICDPPYFSGPEKREFYGQKVSSIGVTRLYKKSIQWVVPGPEFFKEVERVSKNYIVWGCNYYDYIFPSGRIIWDKCNDSSDYSDCEIAATNIHDHVRILRFMWNGMLQGSLSDGSKMQGNKKLNEKRSHPTQKPVQLYKMILKKYAKPGDKILDTHGGSLSIAIACHEMDFDLDVCEIDPYHYERGVERLKQHQSQLKLL
jgi:site-specific DNA-methyltransferase (adenine-specific)